MNARRLVAGTGHVLHVRARILSRLGVGTALAAELQHAVAQSAEKFAIVGDKQHGALEVAQRIEEHFLRHQVEVVGRLVEDQKVGRLQKHARHDEPRLLSSRQGADLLLDLVARELECARKALEHADRFVREIRPQLLFDRQVGIQ